MVYVPLLKLFPQALMRKLKEITTETRPKRHGNDIPEKVMMHMTYVFK